MKTFLVEVACFRHSEERCSSAPLISQSNLISSEFLMPFFTRSSTTILKEGEDQKRKIYSALCVVNKDIPIETIKEKLDAIQDLELSQWTPIRVLHRRPDAKRMRTVYFMEVSPIVNANYSGSKGHHLFLLKLATQAGTYVKEFVHGDFDRTVPNVAQLLGYDVDIIALDVEVRP